MRELCPMRLRHDKFQSQWVFLLAGTLSLAGSQRMLVWILARTAPAEIVGEYGLAQAWILPGFALASLQLRSLMATETRMAQLGNSYLRIRAVAIVLALACVAGLWLCEPLAPTMAPLLAAMGAGRVVELASDFADGLRHRARQYFSLGGAQFTRASAMLAGFSGAWFSTGALLWALLAGCLAAATAAVVLDLPLVMAACRRFRVAETCTSNRQADTQLPGAAGAGRFILRHAIPLALIQFINMAILYAPRVVLSAWHPMEAVAAFTCLASLLGASALMASAYSASLGPVFAAATGEQQRRQVWEAARRIAVAGLPLLALASWLCPWAMTHLFGSSIPFSRTSVTLAVVFAFLWSLATVFGTAATANRQTTLQMLAFGLALTAGMLSALALIPRLGVEGAMTALVCSSATLLSVYAIGYSSGAIAMQERLLCNISLRHPRLDQNGALHDEH